MNENSLKDMKNPVNVNDLYPLMPYVPKWSNTL